MWNHRAHEVMLGCQLSVQGNSGIIGASIWLAIAANHFGKWLAVWQICTENGQWPAVIFSSAKAWVVSNHWTGLLDSHLTTKSHFPVHGDIYLQLTPLGPSQLGGGLITPMYV